MDRYTGPALDNMEDAGLDITLPSARFAARGAGAMMSVVDMLSGVVPLEGALTRALFKEAGKKVFNGRSYVTIAAAKTLSREVGESVVKAPFESANEMAQTLASNFMLELAARKQDALFRNVDWDLIESRYEKIEDAAAGGAFMEITLGISAAFLKSALSLPTANRTARIIEDAFEASATPEAAVKLLEKTDVPDLVEKEGLAEAARRWYEQHPVKLDEGAALKNALRPTEQFPAGMRYKRDGKLNLVFDRPEPDGLETGSVRLYDPYEKSAPMGVLEYRVDDGGIYIDSLELGNYITNSEKVIKDMLYELRNDYGGLPVIWEPEAADYLNARNSVLEAVNTTPVEAERDIRQVFEELLGLKGTVEYVENENDLPPSVQAEINKKRREGFDVPGLSFKTEDGRLAIYMDGKKQNAATLPHEMLHTSVRDAAPETRDRLSAAMGLPDSSEADWNEEKFTSRTAGRGGK
jgi:hypothetical protein